MCSTRTDLIAKKISRVLCLIIRCVRNYNLESVALMNHQLLLYCIVLYGQTDLPDPNSLSPFFIFGVTFSRMES